VKSVRKGVSQIVAAIILIVIAVSALIMYITNFVMYFEKSRGALVELFSQRKEMLLERLAFIYSYSSDSYIDIVVYNYGERAITINTIIVDGNPIDRDYYRVVTIEGTDLDYTIPLDNRLAIISITYPFPEGLHTITIFTELGNAFIYEFVVGGQV